MVGSELTPPIDMTAGLCSGPLYSTKFFAGWSITGPGWEGHQQVRSAEAISTSIDMRPASCTSARLRARHNPLFLTDSLTSQFFTDDYDEISRYTNPA